jgi:hypothetical protein
MKDDQPQASHAKLDPAFIKWWAAQGGKPFVTCPPKPFEPDAPPKSFTSEEIQELAAKKL